MEGDSVIERAVRRFGTPLYLYDFDILERQVLALRRALGPRFTLAYAVKANPSLGVLHFLNRFGLSSDVASRGELAAALRAGFPSSRILSTGPAKSDADLEALVRARVSIIHAEGEWELERLEEIARRSKRRVPVGLRLNPPWGIAEKRTIIGGPGAKKFGVDIRTAEKILRVKEEFPHLDLCGFQVFNTSNVLDASLLVENTRNVLDLGFLRKGFRRVAKEARASGLLDSTRLVFEPGRFLVAEAGTYVTRVLGTKRSRGVDYVLVDGGVHHFLRPVLLESPHRVRLIQQKTAGNPGPLHLQGNLS